MAKSVQNSDLFYLPTAKSVACNHYRPLLLLWSPESKYRTCNGQLQSTKTAFLHHQKRPSTINITMGIECECSTIIIVFFVTPSSVSSSHRHSHSPCFLMTLCLLPDSVSHYWNCQPKLWISSLVIALVNALLDDCLTLISSLFFNFLIVTRLSDDKLKKDIIHEQIYCFSARNKTLMRHCLNWKPNWRTLVKINFD